MGIYKLAKGTGFEAMVDKFAQAEAGGVMMYYSLARMAREQGMEDVAEDFIEAANQEANHAGFFATLNGKYPFDFWQLLRGLAKAENNGEPMFMGVAEKFRAAGMNEAADEMEVFAKQEGGHGKMITKILEKYNQLSIDTTGKKVYVCPVCGYEHVGELDGEPCPICGVSQDKFVEK